MLTIESKNNIVAQAALPAGAGGQSFFTGKGLRQDHEVSARARAIRVATLTWR